MTSIRSIAAVLTAGLISMMAETVTRASTDDPMIDGAIQYALENLVSGTGTSTTIRGTEVSVKPLRTWKSVSGHYCRRFELRIAPPGAAPSTGQHTSCRVGGVWRPSPGH
jgi:hypothetical protein